jgi:MoxR-like ATPase
MFKLKVDYPTAEHELLVMQRMASTSPEIEIDSILSLEELMLMRKALEETFLDEKVEKYIIRLVGCTRHPERFDLDLERYLRFGASPRASIYLSLAARGNAFMEGRDYTTPQDVKDIAHDVLRHRLAISYRAEAESLTPDDLLNEMLSAVPVVEE